MQPTKTVTGRPKTTSDETELKEPATRVTTPGQPTAYNYLTVQESGQYIEVL